MRKALFILGDLSDSDIDWLAAAGAKREVAEGAVLVQEGKRLSEVYILLDGRLSVRLAGRRDEELNVLLPGEFIGELSFLDSRPPSATVVAATRATVAAIPRDQLSTKLEQDTAFAARFYRALGIFLAHRLRRLTVRSTPSREPDDENSGMDADDEIDPELLDSVNLAAKRFEWIQSRFRGE